MKVCKNINIVDDIFNSRREARNMKKILLILYVILFAVLLQFDIVDAKEKSSIQGNFLYEYKVRKEGTWITKITPLSRKGISMLKIPKKLGGKKVVKLGGSGALFFVGDHSTSESNPNIFGVEQSPENDGKLVPAGVQKRVKKIRRISIPSTVNSIALNCFSDVPDGKILNIPKGIVQGLDGTYGFTKIKWKKLNIDSRNKKYKECDGCLLSKSGKKLYGFVQKRKKISIPDGVKIITDGGDYNGASIIVIPKSVMKIEEDALMTEKSVKIKVASKNKHYAVKSGSVYNKRTGRLVAGYIDNGEWNIPETVKIIKYPGLLGYASRLKRIIVPNSVTGIAFPLVLDDKKSLIFEFKGIMPPELLDLPALPMCFQGATIYVPANCKSAYLEKWKDIQGVKFNMIEQGWG